MHNKTSLSSIGVAVVGTGFIGPVHVEGLIRAGVRVTGIVGSSPEKSKLAANELGLARGYASLDEVLSDDSVHAVHIATPNRLHFEQVRAVLNSGRHVLCEKPLAMDSVQSAELVELADRSGCVAGVAYNIRFYPLCHEAAQRTSSESFGTFEHVQGSYVQDWLLHDTDFNWRVQAHDGGELRAVADIGTHWLDLVQFVTRQRIVEVMADLRTVHPIRQRPIGESKTYSGGEPESATEPLAVDTEDCGCVMIRFDNGANGCLWVSQTTAGRKNCLRFEIAGSRQTLAWNSEAPNTMWIGHRDRPSESLICDPTLLGESARDIAQYPGGHNEGFPDTFKQLFRCFYGYIAAGNFKAPQPFPSFSDGHREIMLCEAILRSHRERTWVAVPSI